MSPQDGTGANLKFQADMAVKRRQKIVQNATDLYKFADENLKVPREKSTLSFRVFFYIAQKTKGTDTTATSPKSKGIIQFTAFCLMYRAIF